MAKKSTVKRKRSTRRTVKSIQNNIDKHPFVERTIRTERGTSKKKMRVFREIHGKNDVEIGYCRGKIDDYCVIVRRLKDGMTSFPKDVNCLGGLLTLSRNVGTKAMYEDFVKLFDRTKSDVEDEVFDMIHDMSMNYGDDATTFEKLFDYYYLGMVAEERKMGAVLKKRMKRLGVHMVLKDGFSPYYASVYSKNKKWRDLNEDCKKRGFGIDD